LNLKYTPQIKICGLTETDKAVRCAELGADAIGLVFHPKSPRFVSDGKAREICSALSEKTKKVGVFVDESFETIIKKADNCGLDSVQLHGNESPDLAAKLMKEKLTVIKALFLEKEPYFETAARYQVSAFLGECGKGVLPGGNALSWDWEKGKVISGKYPLILAGGLTPDNVSLALSVCLPDAVDVSSGVESAPGIKDTKKVELFIVRTRSSAPANRPWRIF
jgi:phosphoribosylanthranilate isomerase/indole-3-glycerol phosphate synthase/phosphoribosylanthranilate isomerase